MDQSEHVTNIADQVPPSSLVKQNQNEELIEIFLFSVDEVVKSLSLFLFWSMKNELFISNVFRCDRWTGEWYVEENLELKSFPTSLTGKKIVSSEILTRKKLIIHREFIFEDGKVQPVPIYVVKVAEPQTVLQLDKSAYVQLLTLTG